jgi:hypothetical protein
MRRCASSPHAATSRHSSYNNTFAEAASPLTRSRSCADRVNDSARHSPWFGVRQPVTAVELDALKRTRCVVGGEPGCLRRDRRVPPSPDERRGRQHAPDPIAAPERHRAVPSEGAGKCPRLSHSVDIPVCHVRRQTGPDKQRSQDSAACSEEYRLGQPRQLEQRDVRQVNCLRTAPHRGRHSPRMWRRQHGKGTNAFGVPSGKPPRDNTAPVVTNYVRRLNARRLQQRHYVRDELGQHVRAPTRRTRAGGVTALVRYEDAVARPRQKWHYLIEGGAILWKPVETHHGLALPRSAVPYVEVPARAFVPVHGEDASPLPCWPNAQDPPPEMAVIAQCE